MKKKVKVQMNSSSLVRDFSCLSLSTCHCFEFKNCESRCKVFICYLSSKCFSCHFVFLFVPLWPGKVSPYFCFGTDVESLIASITLHFATINGVFPSLSAKEMSAL